MINKQKIAPDERKDPPTPPIRIDISPPPFESRVTGVKRTAGNKNENIVTSSMAILRAG